MLHDYLQAYVNKYGFSGYTELRGITLIILTLKNSSESNKVKTYSGDERESLRVFLTLHN